MANLLPLADAASLGGKAGRLAQLIAAGLPVPEGFVVIGPVGDELEAAVARLAPFAVRSSMSVEDGARGSAAGVFASRIDVPLGELRAAIEAVWASAGTPLARAYTDATVRPAVIVQRFVPGARTTIYTRPPGRPGDDEAWLEPPLRRVPRSDPALALALAAEHAIAAPLGADVELVGDFVVQARPIVHPAPPRPRISPPPSLFTFSARTPEITWRWDVAHNPDPLSPAQAGLVDLVSSHAPLALAASYLYYAAGPLPLPSPLPLPDLIAQMHSLVAGNAPDLPTALAHYVAAHRVYSLQIAPALAARPRTGARRTTGLEATLIAAARGELSESDAIAALADHAPAWDVAVPTYGERPELIRAAIARLRAVLGELPPPPDTLDETAALAELDDVAFARAQAHVRAALLAHGAALGLDDPADACWLPLDDLVHDHPIDPPRARARAAAARTARDRARAWAMPLAVRAGVPLDEPGAQWRGAGQGATVVGIVHRIDDLGAAALVPPSSIAVVPTVTPALALVLAGARAIVSAHGGLLDHGAAIARELGIPCVVGCAAAWAELRDGELIEVSGDLGTVTRA